MAIKLEKYNLILTIKTINYSYPGGFDLFCEHNLSKFAENYCHDAHIFRAGADDLHDIESLILYWQERGLVPYNEIKGKKHWKDMCVIEASEPTFPCTWLEIDHENNAVFFKRKPKGKIIGREEMMLYYGL